MKKIIYTALIVMCLLIFSSCKSEEKSAEEAQKEKMTAEEIAKQEEEARIKEEERKKAEEEARRKAEEEARIKAEEELRAKTFYLKLGAELFADSEFSTPSEETAAHKAPVVIKKEIWKEVKVEKEPGEEGESSGESTEAGTESGESTEAAESAADAAGKEENKAESKEEGKDTEPVFEKKLVGYELESVDGTPSKAFVKIEDVYAEPYDFIEYPVEGVSYGPFSKKTYESNPPIKVRGVYVTRNSAVNGGGMLDYLINLARTTDINTFVIDVKDDNGYLLFKTKAAEKYMPEENERAAIDDIKGFIKRLKDENIYLVARIVTFKSPQYAEKHPEKSLKYKESGQLYSDGDGIYWSSPYGRELWDYNISIAEEAADLGFNEIQFDYVRFPATSEEEDQILEFYNENNESKSLAISKFLQEAYKRLSAKEVYVTADLFGWMASAVDDQNIGQHWESLVSFVDYIAPMMYPSHYGPGNFGLDVPDAQPYACIDGSIKDAISRNKNVYTPGKLRPWIQDFTASWVPGYINYGPAEVMAQIKALKDNGIDEYMLWNAANYYSDGGLHNDAR